MRNLKKTLEFVYKWDEGTVKSSRVLNENEILIVFKTGSQTEFSTYRFAFDADRMFQTIAPEYKVSMNEGIEKALKSIDFLYDSIYEG